MNFKKLILQRRACHHFVSGKKITDQDFKKIIELVRFTPSGYNAQPWEFILVRDKKRLKRLQAIAFDQPHVTEASGMVVVLGDKNMGRHADQIMKEWVKHGYVDEKRVLNYLASMKKKRGDDKQREMALRNSALAAMVFMLAAEDLGFATCPMMGFRQWELEEFLEIPSDRIVTLLIAIGYADRSKLKKQLSRKSVDEMIYKEKFGQKF